MGIRIIIAALILIVWATGCMKDDDNDAVSDKLATVLTIQSGAAVVFQENYNGPADSINALDAMGQWLLEQDGVDKVFYIGLDAVEINYTNGLRSSILLTEVDADGQHLTRGGGDGSRLKAFNTSVTKEKIKNEKVLVLNPFVNEFYNGNYTKAPKFQIDGEPMNVDVYNGSGVTFSALNSMDDYGFVVLNTHGLKYGFLLYKLFDEPQNPEQKNWTKEEALALLELNGGADVNKIASGEIELGLNLTFNSVSYNVKQYITMVVTTKYIANSRLDMEDAVVFGNFCYSGYTIDGPGYNNIPQAFRSLNAATYYGYAFETGFSMPVSNPFAKRMEDSLIANLTLDLDTTGAAHLANNAITQYETKRFVSTEVQEAIKGRGFTLVPPNYYTDVPFYFLQFFDGNYTFRPCIDSIIDTRDNQVYYTVCVGGRAWMNQNLNYNVPGSVCFDSLASNCEIYGRLYSRTEVFGGQSPSTSDTAIIKGICPDGWHIPTAKDWANLEIAVGVPKSEANNLTLSSHGELYEAGSKLMNETGWKPYTAADGPSTDSLNLSGFSALPGGFWRNNNAAPFSPPMELAYFWSSTWMDNMQGVMLRRLRYNFVGVYIWDDEYLGVDQERYSCRCVQD